MKNELNKKLLTKEQVTAVRQMICNSLRGGFINSNQTIPENFDMMSGKIADAIIHNTQMVLGQQEVFKKVLKKEEKKVVKKVIKKKK
jgi:hypothetical protein